MRADAMPHCARCDALCCRLTVVLQPEDRLPAHLTTIGDSGMLEMARDEDGWCVALDGASMRCSIYDSRPQPCRWFAMAGDDCRDVRNEYLQTPSGDHLPAPNGREAR